MHAASFMNRTEHIFYRIDSNVLSWRRYAIVITAKYHLMPDYAIPSSPFSPRWMTLITTVCTYR